MSIDALRQAKSDAVAAKARFLGTLGEAQQRLKPGNLAGEAWTEVKKKSAVAAGEAVAAAKRRPGTVALVLGGLALFLARKPIARGVGSLVSRRRRKRGGNESDG